ncbi:hypothetical protein OHB35_53215 [Streptomyces phaeochromogenes]|uniref:Uncharacterized protein n=1 Tax=Streptomyces phaeochromogenes TaxID=1923 RepID=A0ABZ1HRR7_STRPH|nr:hypothetical protein [Streptomyces phaeochromogenes]WSD11751.1 hypothetical protein OHB35_00120 [Streptomyces phaeochromogenes]WSD21298.1 hypothetical protein OHB35_53215 [Streptomyces phaeochromogenes]
MPEHVDFFEAIVTAYPDDADHAPLLQDPVHARVARAGDVADGDLILAAVSLHGTDYFNDQYTAHPEPYKPTADAACAATSPTSPARWSCSPTVTPGRPATRGSPTPWSSSSPSGPCATGPRRSDGTPCPAPRTRLRCPASPPTTTWTPSSRGRNG